MELAASDSPVVNDGCGGDGGFPGGIDEVVVSEVSCDVSLGTALVLDAGGGTDISISSIVFMPSIVFSPSMVAGSKTGGGGLDLDLNDIDACDCGGNEVG